ncbi:MAG TPA: hypothetical protein VLB04_05310 [Methanotrichaceae archaeon]|nr:hypothetical protein [Methanotrichaceae archaeon]
MQLLPYLIYLAGSDLRLVLYFLLGGSVTVLTAYLAGLGRGTLSAFIATLPLLTVLSFLLIYAEGGEDTVHEYARGLLIFTPPWIAYVATVMLATERLGIFRSLGIGVLVYVLLSGISRQLLLGAKP